MGPARYRPRHITPPAATATGPVPPGGVTLPRGLPARDVRRLLERLQHPGSAGPSARCRAVPSRAGPPRVGGLRHSIRRPHGGQRRGAMCAPGLLCRLLLLLLFLLLLLPPAPGAAPPGRPRARRGLTYPGTLWCGAGSNADSYEQLGKGGRDAATWIFPSHLIPSLLIPSHSLPSLPVPFLKSLLPIPPHSTHPQPSPVLGQSPPILIQSYPSTGLLQPLFPH